ncbi:MAG: tyrosine--tRNA ligase [bacterium]
MDKEQKLKELLERGVETIYPNRAFLEKKLKSGERLSVFTGYDPTADTLHIGHGISFLKLRQFQDLGHKVIMLIGDFTGMIGDPTDKSATRVALTREQVVQNAKNYKKQASAILDFESDNKVEIMSNSQWFDKMNVRDFFEITSHFTVPRLLERDMFQDRLNNNGTIYLHEFMYPVMQAYDCVAMNVDGEVGGNDQTFNMLAGRSLMKEIKNKEKFVLSYRLLTDNSGKKMGKTEGNMVAFSDSPADMFGKVMSWDDEMITNGFELCTRVPMEEIKDIFAQIKNKANPRDFKLKLAYEITKTFLGEKQAKAGRDHFAKVIQSKDRPDNIEAIKPSNYDIITVLVEAGFCTSRSEARKLVAQEAVKVNDKKVASIDQKLGKGDTVQKGKRFFVKVK